MGIWKDFRSYRTYSKHASGSWPAG